MKKKKIYPFEAFGWIQRIIFFFKVRERQIWYHVFMESKNNTNESVHKIENRLRDIENKLNKGNQEGRRNKVEIWD